MPVNVSEGLPFVKRSVSHLLFELGLSFNLAILGLDVRMVCRKLSQSRQVLQSLLSLALVNEVSWCLRHEWNHQAHQRPWNDLNTHCRPPLSVIMLMTFPQADTVVRPESQAKAENDHQVIGGGHRTSN